jgi:hypothetical protein
MAAGQGVSGALTNYDPWADARDRFGDWVIRHRPLQGLHEVLCWRRKVILLEVEHCRATRTSNLAHAIAHLDLKHRASTGFYSKRDEAAADRLAAGRLIGLEQLGDALATHPVDPDLVAEHLDVTVQVLRTRLRALNDDDKEHIRQRMARRGEAA